MSFLLLMFLLRNLPLFWWVYFYVICLFSHMAFNILFLFFVPVDLKTIYHGEVLLWSSMFVVLEASSTWMGESYLRFGKFSIIILLNILWTFRLALLLLLQCPWFPGLIFWWNHCVCEYSFHSSWVVWLKILLFFSLISVLSLSSESMSSIVFF
jgi:hypothetical protein